LLVLTAGMTSVVALIFTLLHPPSKSWFWRQDALSVAHPASNSFPDKGVWEE
jgi:hypothetical protein